MSSIGSERHWTGVVRQAQMLDREMMMKIPMGPRSPNPNMIECFLDHYKSGSDQICGHTPAPLTRVCKDRNSRARRHRRSKWRPQTWYLEYRTILQWLALKVCPEPPTVGQGLAYYPITSDARGPRLPSGHSRPVLAIIVESKEEDETQPCLWRTSDRRIWQPHGGSLDRSC